MSEPVITPEVVGQIARGISGETLPSGVPPTVEKALQAFFSHQAEQALQIVAGEVSPFSKEDVEMTLVENLGERDPNTGKKKEPTQTGPGKERFDRTMAIAEQIGTYLENPQTNPPQELLKITYSYLASSPAFRELIVDNQGNIKTQDAEAIARTLLHQPQVRKKIMELYTHRLDPARRLPSDKETARLEQEIRRIMEELGGEDIESLIEEKRRDISKKDIEIQNMPQYKEYSELQEKLNYLKREKASLEVRLKTARDSRSGGETINPDIEKTITELTTGTISKEEEIFEIEQALIAFQKNNQNIPFFIKMQESSQLKEQLQALEQKKASIDPKKRRELQAELAEKQAQLMESRSLLLAEQIKYAAEIQAIVPDALKGYLDEALGSVFNNYKEEAKREAEQRGTEDKEILAHAVDKIISRLGRKLKRKGGMEMYVPDKRKAQGLLQKLLLPDGVDKLFERNGELALVKSHLISNYGLSKKEAEVFIEEVQKDPQYRRQLALRLAGGIFADYISQGGRLSQDVVVALTSTDWGQQLLKEGQETINNRRAELEKVFGKGIISRVDELKGKGKEWFREHPLLGGLGIILLLIMLGFLGSKGLSVLPLGK